MIADKDKWMCWTKFWWCQLSLLLYQPPLGASSSKVSPLFHFSTFPLLAGAAIFQVWLLLNTLQYNCKVGNFWGGSQVELYILLFKYWLLSNYAQNYSSSSQAFDCKEKHLVIKFGGRFIAQLANVSFSEGRRENVSKNGTSSQTINYLEQVANYFQSEV